MKRWFASLPIHRKLVALALAVSAAALTAAVAGLLAFDIERFRTSAIDDAHALAQVIAENTAAAIMFDDEDAAQATLSSVRVRPTIVAACVYRADGSLLSSFVRSASSACPAEPRDEETWRSVSSSAAVTRNGRSIGTVFVLRELSDLGPRVVATASAGALMLLVGAAIALALARSLQTVISRPIVALAHAAASVGGDQQYVLPAIDAPPDEIGDLVRAFGDMVRRIGETNAALRESNVALRSEVEQRRAMQAEREALLAREREASRLKDEFLAAVSHELRTPLNAILGWTQILQTTDPSGETTARAVASLARNAQAQNRVIEDLLDISRIITGKLQLAVAPLDLRSVIAAAVEVTEPTAASRHVEVHVDVPESPCIVQGDADRLRQVLWNLLSNALKFTPPGGRVDVRLSSTADECVLTVSDTGVGIPSSFLAHVFERFRQADGSMTREQGGLGLGLAIVKELTELHGGSVRAESAGKGQGATFTVSLPRASGEKAARPRDDGATIPGPSLAGIDVMVVDDNADALEIVSLALESAGAHVRRFHSGADAVAEWAHRPADVLLCDLAMPGMDGFEVLARVRAADAGAGRTTSAIAVTAYASEEDRARCVGAGFVRHLAKPYSIADVVSTVAAVAAGS
jgi:signal transduction histidine kinase